MTRAGHITLCEVVPTTLIRLLKYNGSRQEVTMKQGSFLSRSCSMLDFELPLDEVSLDGDHSVRAVFTLQPCLTEPQVLPVSVSSKSSFSHFADRVFRDISLACTREQQTRTPNRSQGCRVLQYFVAASVACDDWIVLRGARTVRGVYCPGHTTWRFEPRFLVSWSTYE